MRQKWRQLLFLHWPVDPSVLRPLVPPELELDLYDGVAYVGLVPFTMRGVRPVGLPAVAGLSNFHETNVRTYVRLGDCNPGVWFFSLDAANPVAVTLARRLFHLPYHLARMLLEIEPSNSDTERAPILYAGTRLWPDPIPASYALRAAPTSAPTPAQPGTLEHFLIERYILYSKFERSLFEGRVHHAPYPVQSATLLSIDETLLAAAGIQRPALAPLAHFARGVDVDIFALQSAV
jgi:uncharacterized protein YqjF (DUF2071 family)